MNPLRGQNNVQGACDMGALPDVFPGYQKVADPAARARVEKAWGKPLSDKPGLTVVEMMNAAHAGKLKAMYIMGENPLVTDPDLHHVAEAIKRLDFLVVQDIFFTETAALADVILPGAAFAEKDGTFTNTERRVQMVRKAVEPPGEAKPDWQIISAIALRLGGDKESWEYASPAAIMAEAAAITPQYAGISYEGLKKAGSSGPAHRRTIPGRRFCTWANSVAGWASSGRWKASRPPSRPTPSIP